MITSKFVWESFEKYKDETFYINEKSSVSYGQFYQKVKTIANQNKLQNKNEKEVLYIDSSLDSLVTLFSFFYCGTIPILLSKKMPKDKATELLLSIQNEKLSSNENATIIFTSGSTSTPKAILHTYSNYYYSALGSNENIPIHKNDKWLLSLPLHHIGGLSILFRVLISGGTLVGYDKAISLEETISKHSITHLSVVATQLKRMIQNLEKLQTLKAILVGGGQVSGDLIRDATILNLPIYKTYGMSEMSSQITTTSENASQEELRTSGKILKYREIEIADDNEILVRGEVLCKQYLNGNMHIDSDGWFHTGDIGSLDAKGNLTVLGRKDNMFISGGENIYPEPIEKLLMQMDNIEEVCIVPKEHTEFGQVPVLFYKTENNTEISIGFVKEFLHDKVMSFEIPKEIYLFPKEYKSQGIKLDRAFLKQWIKNR